MTPPRVHNQLLNTAPPNAVYVGRPSPWGNPFSHLPSRMPGVIVVATRREAIERFEQWLDTHPAGRKILARAMVELKGKHLVCHCAPAPCHADVLLRRVNPKEPS